MALRSLSFNFSLEEYSGSSSALKQVWEVGSLKETVKSKEALLSLRDQRELRHAYYVRSATECLGSVELQQLIDWSSVREFQGKVSNIFWFNPLKCQDYLLLFVIHFLGFILLPYAAF